ncbi:MAG: Calx-beta domain-containing protein, partial [Isosphaeraceae bacterium]
NSTPGADTIKFAIGSGFASIALSSALPDISDAVTIDGTSQPGYSGNPMIEINGAGAGSSAQGFKVTSGLVTLQGLVINRFAKQGIWLFGGGSNVVRNCWIGLNATGSAAAANGDDGIFIDKSSGNTIGGLATGDRNVISGNSAKGIHFLFNGQANNNKMIGNYIGTDITGKYAIGNGASGIDFFGPATYNTISYNVISGNAGHGITFFGGDASDNLITDNNIGVDVTGVQGIPNNGNGVDIWGPPRISVKNNVIAANKGSGVVINSENIIVQGNFIGTDRTRTVNLGNLDYGVIVGGLSSPKDTRIGGPNLADGNVIANNGSYWGRPGVSVSTGSTGVLIFNNIIYDNASIGIDLNADNKVTLNDTGDPDTGGNNLLNFPVITTAVGGTGKVTIAGTYNGLANTNFTLQFFSSVAADPTGYGEGRDILGTTNITTDATGNATFNVSYSSSLVVVGSKISATATTAGNGVGSGYTSEFCQTVSVTAAPTADLAITAQPVTGAVLGTNYSYSYRVTNNGPNSVTLVSVNVPLPAWLTYTSSSATSTNVDAANLVSMDVGTLAAGASADLTLTVFPTAFGPTSTTASVVGLSTDNNAANNNVTTNVNIKDKPGSFAFDSPTLQVGEYETMATVYVNRVGGSGGAASVTYRVAAGSAESGTDYSSPNSGVLNFADGQSRASFTIPIVNDNLYEGNESINLSLVNPTNSTALGSPNISVLTLLDDDPAPDFSITNGSQPEGTGTGQSVVFMVSLSAPSGLPATVTYTTVDGTATAGQDYTATAGILIFSPGETSKPVTVVVNGDALLENDEVFYVDLSAPSQASIVKSRGVATLVNDDAPPAISVADTSITETTGTSTQMVFNVVLSVPSGLTTKVNYATAAGTAVSPGDFTTASGQLVFLPGETSKQVKVTI